MSFDRSIVQKQIQEQQRRLAEQRQKSLTQPQYPSSIFVAPDGWSHIFKEIGKNAIVNGKDPMKTCSCEIDCSLHEGEWAMAQHGWVFMLFLDGKTIRMNDRLNLYESISTKLGFYEYLNAHGLSEISPFTIKLSNHCPTQGSDEEKQILHFFAHSSGSGVMSNGQSQQSSAQVLKLDRSSGGRGVFFVNSLEDCVRVMNTVVNDDKNVWLLQRQVYPPMLLDNHKFHVRTYSIAFGGSVFVLGNIDTRSAAQQFQSGNWGNEQVHLTNSRINRDTLPTHLTPLNCVPQLMTYHSHILHVMARLFKGNRCEKVSLEQLRSSPMSPHQHDDWYQFDVLATDILMTEDGRPFILEVNHGPGLTIIDKMPPSYLSHMEASFTSILNILSSPFNVDWGDGCDIYRVVQ